MDERARFIAMYLEGETMAASCRAAGVSRQTGYKWLTRFERGGLESLYDQSRAAQERPNATATERVEDILGLRAKHPTWGPRKLRGWLIENEKKHSWPAASTIGEILKRHGLIVPRTTRRRAWAVRNSDGAPTASNLCWATDFKGHFRVGDRSVCYPLTLQDGFSRKLLRCQAIREQSSRFAKPVFEAAFREFGVPKSIRSDNGSPFASTSFCALTPLSAWWTKLGIELQRIEPGHPEQNGRLERLHRTLKLETASPPKRSLRAQQQAFDDFRVEYNAQRPHEALGQLPPDRFYQPSPIEFSGRIAEPEYPGHFELRQLNTNGEAHFQRFRFTVGKALAAEWVAFEPMDDGLWKLRFYGSELGWLDERRALLTRPGFRMKVEFGDRFKKRRRADRKQSSGL